MPSVNDLYHRIQELDQKLDALAPLLADVKNLNSTVPPDLNQLIAQSTCGTR